MPAVTNTISQDQISIGALKVLNRLADHGYEAYLVGGGVRDLILGAHPKDFDIATSAHPEEVNQLFRNSRLIGRRFRIVHVRFGREIVEVATFRAHQNSANDQANQTDSGMILSDNVYGTFEEDAFRRDFSINGLYYNPRDDGICDLVGGMDDIRSKTIRLIGDPDSRYREDPVRMLRAVRFAAKLGFSIDKKTRDPISEQGYLIQDVPAARLFEEVLKLFMSGYGTRCYELLKEYQLFQWLFPGSYRSMEDYPADKFITLSLASTDRRIKAGLPVTPAFVFAALFWYPFLSHRTKIIEEGATQSEASYESASLVVANQQLFTSIPKRFTSIMKDMWNLQFRLPNRSGKKPEILLNHKRFRASYDFLILREEAGELAAGLGDWWTRYQECDAKDRLAMVKSSGGGKRKHKASKRH